MTGRGTSGVARSARLLGAGAGGLHSGRRSRRSRQRAAADGRRRRQRAPSAMLEARVRELGRAFDGEVGIAVRDIDDRLDRRSWNGGRFFPQQSVSKFWVALTALAARRRAASSTSTSASPSRREDLTLFHQPIAAQIGAERLYDDARRPHVPRADPERQYLQRHRPAPRRRARRRCARCSSATGSTASASAPASGCCRARSPACTGSQRFLGRQRLLPGAQRRARRPPPRRRSNAISTIRSTAPRPTASSPASPGCSAANCCRRASTERLLSIMSQTRTGPQRLRGGLAPGWRSRTRPAPARCSARDPGRL